ncbi:hypothetical protein KKB43_03480 [Patescibacteria group bacterium]|nr:hypothetical protein [Patescibacteria group bacterium]MBU4580052.1 hypothetical protein [Patescibacteria group bacterium]
MRFANKIIILFLLFAAVSINASGVTINPSKIDLAVKINKPSSEKITITNPTSDVQIFKAYPIPLSISIIASENNFPSRVSRQTYYNLAIIVLFGIGALEHFVLRKKRMSA